MDSKKIGEILRELRGERSQSAVAEAIGISDSAISAYENGERIPRDETKKKIAAFYNRSVQDIFFEHE